MSLILHKEPLADATIGVWAIKEDIQWFKKRLLLNEVDHEAMAKINVDSKLLEFLASRYLLRVLLDSDKEHTLEKDKHGKPAVKDAAFHISVSHCKGYAAAVISHNHLVGIDIEPVHPRIRRITSKYMSINEMTMLNGQDATDENLIAAWAIKEAVYKANGRKGVSLQNQIFLPVTHHIIPAKLEVVMSFEKIDSKYTVITEKVNECVLAIATMISH